MDYTRLNHHPAAAQWLNGTINTLTIVGHATLAAKLLELRWSPMENM